MQKPKAQNQESKQSYHKPQIFVYGNLKTLTLTVVGAKPQDGGTGQNKNMS